MLKKVHEDRSTGNNAGVSVKRELSYCNLLKFIDTFPDASVSYEVSAELIPEYIKHRFEAMKREIESMEDAMLNPLAWYCVDIPSACLSQKVTKCDKQPLYLIQRKDGSLWVWFPAMPEELKVFRIAGQGIIPVVHTYFVIERKGGEDE